MFHCFYQQRVLLAGNVVDMGNNIEIYIGSVFLYFIKGVRILSLFDYNSIGIIMTNIFVGLLLIVKSKRPCGDEDDATSEIGYWFYNFDERGVQDSIGRFYQRLNAHSKFFFKDNYLGEQEDEDNDGTILEVEGMEEVSWQETILYYYRIIISGISELYHDIVDSGVNLTNGFYELDEIYLNGAGGIVVGSVAKFSSFIFWFAVLWPLIRVCLVVLYYSIRIILSTYLFRGSGNVIISYIRMWLNRVKRVLVGMYNYRDRLRLLYNIPRRYFLSFILHPSRHYWAFIQNYILELYVVGKVCKAYSYKIIMFFGKYCKLIFKGIVKKIGNCYLL